MAQKVVCYNFLNNIFWGVFSVIGWNYFKTKFYRRTCIHYYIRSIVIIQLAYSKPTAVFSYTAQQRHRCKVER